MVDAAAGLAPGPGIVYFGSLREEPADTLLHQFFRSVSVSAPDGEPDTIAMGVIQLGPLIVGHFSFAAPVTLAAAELGAYHVALPTAGRLHARTRGTEITATTSSALTFPPGEPIHLRHDAHSAELGLKIDESALTAELTALLGHPVRDPVDLPPVFDLTTGPAQSWSRLLRLLRDELDHETSLIHEPLIAEQLSSSVLSGLLLSVPHRYRDELVQPATAGPPRAIQRVLDAMNDEPERAFTVTALAAVAGMSVRSLQEGFRRHVGVAPMAYLQQVRLARARDALRYADPARVTVAAVAHRWGFAHLGRFASAYRARFGESPSETLRSRG